jgi:hypothetical protein
MGKELWEHRDGSDLTPTEDLKSASWKIKDAWIMTRMLAFVDLLIILNLRLYKTTKSMWEYLKKVYSQNNMAQQFQLEYEIANYTYGYFSIQECFTRFQILEA